MTVQRDDAWLKTATPKQVAAAHAAGELADLLAKPPTAPAPVRAPEGQYTEAQARGLTPEQTAEALAAGRLDFVMGRIPGEPIPEPEGPPRGSGEF